MTRRSGCWVLMGAALVLAAFLNPVLSPGADLTVDGGATYTVNSDVTFNNNYIGYLSAGTLNQGSFNNTVTGSLYLGYNSGSSGAYNLSGGSLSSGSVEIIGNFGSGVFTQSGGANTCGNLFLGYNAGGNGVYNQSGGTNILSGILYLGFNPGSSGVYNLTAGSLSTGFAYIGYYGGPGVFNQSGGANLIDQNLYLGGYPGGSGVYNLSGGSLHTLNQLVGYYGNGVFNQNGGSNTIDTRSFIGFTLGYWNGSDGTYNLNNGTLSSPFEVIGVYGVGTFNQSSGANQVRDGLTLGLGNGLGGSGTYNLNGGSLSAHDQWIGYNGTGAFNQSGGSNTVASDLYLGYHSSGIGFYNLSSGSLSTTNTIIGNSGAGTFAQTGGSQTVSKTLTLGVNVGGSGAYNLQGGSLNAGTINLNANGAFNQTGGSLNAAIFNQQGGTVTGSLENRGAFNYASGLFSGRLLNYGTVNFNADFTAGNGLANFSAAPLTIAQGRTVTLNGQGLDNQGSLVVNGILTGNGPLVNNTSGILSGNGTVAGSFINSGIVNPGSSVGSLNMVGSYTQAAVGKFLWEVGSPTSYDKINVTGSAGLNGRLTPVLLGGYRPQPNQVFSGVLTATGGITGGFIAVGNFTPTLVGIPRYNANSVDLLVQRDYNNPELGLNSNQAAVGALLNGLAGAASGDLGGVLNTLDSLPTSGDVQDAFKQISPEKAAALTTLGFAGASFQMRNLATRTTNLRFLSGEMTGGGSLGSLGLNYSRLDGVMLAYNGASLPSLFSARRELKPPASRWGLFLDGGAAFGSQKSTVNQTGFDFTLSGCTAGGDYRATDNLLLGLATGYSHTASGFRGSGGGVSANTIPINAYAAYFPGSLYAYGSLGYALNLFDLERGLNFGGLSRSAKSSTSGHQFNLYGETGYDLRLRRVILTPAATLAYSRLWVGGFSEQDAGALDLKVGAQTADSLQTGLGGRLTVPFTAGRLKVAPQAYAFYQHEFANGSRGLNASLSQAGGSFAFQTDAAARNFAIVGGSLNLGLKENLWVQFNYNAEVGRGSYTAQFVNAGLRYEF